MSFIKIGELVGIDIQSTESSAPMVDQDALNKFYKMAGDLKKVAPKADDFLYMVAVIMHAAEASAVNDDGTPKLNRFGEEVKVGWDTSNNTWRWVSSDPSVRAFKNSNGDIFPESQLITAHKKWIGKPLCLDHKSSSVDHTRGFIVDTYYDRKLKRVVALCALDKANYPELARKVSTGMQTAVSMGTAVGQAICYDCAKVARVESDFCSHMKTKSGYGEINVDLNPIELSIVVNGADPKAHIKQVLAAANHLNAYVESKQNEIEKLADLTFNAQLDANDSESNEGPNHMQINVNANDLVKFKQDLDDAFAKLSNIYDLAKKSEKDSNNSAYNQSSGSIAMSEGTPTDSGLSLQSPQQARYAAVNLEKDSIEELKEVALTIEAKLNQMKESLEKLSKTSKTQEEMMSDMNKKGYYQGAGGVNEPTPGQVKYPKDPLNETAREEDKHMNGQAPFPEVGAVDGMHPSPASAETADELTRKKMLARAESEDRAVKRAAILQLAKGALQDKKAYFQNGDGKENPGTPTPGKVKYPADKLNELDRDKEDKQMVGQKPFPGVGSVDSLHPSPASVTVPDELKRKELLQRASLRARFVKAAKSDGTQDKANSAWEVFLGDKLILTASVDELTGGRTEMLYDQIATKPFGTSLIEKVKVAGASGVSALIKKSQAAPMAPAAPAAPDAASPADLGAPEAEDTGKTGDPKENVLELAEKARDLNSDLVESVRALTGEQAEMGAEPAPEMGAAASDNFGTAALKSTRKELNGQLVQAMKETIANLTNHQEELEMISSMYDKGAVSDANRDFVGTIVEDAVKETKHSIADGLTLMTAFVKYARGTNAIVKRAEIEAELEALAEGESMSEDTHLAEGADLMNLIGDTNADLESVKEMLDDKDEEMHADDNDMKLEVAPGEAVPKDVPMGAQVEVKKASLETKEARASFRAKLAADALGKQDDGEAQDMSKAKFSDMLDKADSLADGQTKLDTKPSGNLGLVETQEEQNKAFMDLAKAPPKVRKEAEAIQRLVSEGKLDAKDVDALVAEGLDKDAVAYWKKFYGQVDGGSEFASELVKEHVKAQLEADLNKFKLKIARAYELTYDMIDRGLCGREKAQVKGQVDEIMLYDDVSFESFKRVVAKHEPLMQKQASRLPNVGFSNDESPSKRLVENDMVASLSGLFGNKKGSF
jgi:hypothetical protein